MTTSTDQQKFPVGPKIKLDSLPWELLTMVSKNLGFRDLRALRFTNRFFHHAITPEFIEENAHHPDRFYCSICGRWDPEGKTVFYRARDLITRRYSARPNPLDLPKMFCVFCAVHEGVLPPGEGLITSCEAKKMVWVCPWCGWPVYEGNAMWEHEDCHKKGFAVEFAFRAMKFLRLGIPVAASVMSIGAAIDPFGTGFFWDARVMVPAVAVLDLTILEIVALCAVDWPRAPRRIILWALCHGLLAFFSAAMLAMPVYMVLASGELAFKPWLQATLSLLLLAIFCQVCTMIGLGVALSGYNPHKAHLSTVSSRRRALHPVLICFLALVDGRGFWKSGVYKKVRSPATQGWEEFLVAFIRPLRERRWIPPSRPDDYARQLHFSGQGNIRHSSVDAADAVEESETVRLLEERQSRDLSDVEAQV